MRSVPCICGWWGSTSRQAQSLPGRSKDERYEPCSPKKEKERKGKKKRMKRTRPWKRRVVDNAEQKVVVV